MTTALVDYGAGNLTSVVKALDACGTTVRIAASHDQLHDAHAVVIPGVGHFGRTASLDDRWRDAIRSQDRRRRSRARHLPRHALAVSRQRGGPGRRWAWASSPSGAPGSPARSKSRMSAGIRSTPTEPAVTSPPRRRPGRVRVLLPFLCGCRRRRCRRDDDRTADPFASVVERDGVAGAQFHPEKSADTGLRLLSNFLAMARAEAEC